MTRITNLSVLKTIQHRELFENVSGYGKYTVKSYLLEDDNLRSKTQEIEYNEDSSKNEDTSIGKAKSLTLSEHNVTINVGDENKILDAVIMPEFAYDNKVAWKSSDESIVKSKRKRYFNSCVKRQCYNYRIIRGRNTYGRM